MAIDIRHNPYPPVLPDMKNRIARHRPVITKGRFRQIAQVRFPSGWNQLFCGKRQRTIRITALAQINTGRGVG